VWVFLEGFELGVAGEGLGLRNGFELGFVEEGLGLRNGCE